MTNEYSVITAAEDVSNLIDKLNFLSNEGWLPRGDMFALRYKSTQHGHDTEYYVFYQQIMRDYATKIAREALNIHV
jgi:hypothetical protein